MEVNTTWMYLFTGYLWRDSGAI